MSSIYYNIKIYFSLIRAKELYVVHPEFLGMCHCIGLAMECKERGYSNLTSETIKEIIPEFNRKFLEAPEDRYGKAFWWDPETKSGRKGRIEAFDKLIEVYRSKKSVKFVLWMSRIYKLLTNKKSN